jgi:hypothetical protein
MRSFFIVEWLVVQWTWGAGNNNEPRSLNLDRSYVGRDIKKSCRTNKQKKEKVVEDKPVADILVRTVRFWTITGYQTETGAAMLAPSSTRGKALVAFFLSSSIFFAYSPEKKGNIGH